MSTVAAQLAPQMQTRSPSSRRALLAIALLSLALVAALLQRVAGEHSAVAPAIHPSRVSHKGLLSLPLAARGPVSAAMGADSPAYRIGASGGGFAAASPAQRLSMRFGRSGVSVSSGGTSVQLSLHAVGYGTALHALGEVSPRVHGNRVVYARADLSEWYANGPLGLEQGFTVPRAPARQPAGPLTLSMALAGDAHASLAAAAGQSLTLSHAGGPSLRYGGLVVTDARGSRLHSWLELSHGTVLLRVAARGARYPLRIDPWIEQGSRITPSGEEGAGWFGADVALSANGQTALIGAPMDDGDRGAAWVFTRSGETWTQQGPKLTGREEVGPAWFGYVVALSADGNTALIDGARDNGDTGAAWVFTRFQGAWAQQGPKLTGKEESSFGQFGWSVALSSDGNTALIGGSADSGNVGAIWAFTRRGETWTQQGPKLTGSEEIGDGYFGFSVALSANGNTALVGGYTDDGSVGAAWVFTRSGETWTQQGPKLTGSEASGERRFGDDVALSSDGNTALVGGGYDDGVGAAWVFTRSGETWTQQGPKLTGTEEIGSGQFGDGVALSSDGDTALIGGPGDHSYRGAAWVFTRSGETWTQQGKKLKAGAGVATTYAGLGVALSADGNTALVGGILDLRGNGAAWVYTNSAASPTPETGSASEVTRGTATLNATVDPNGKAVSGCEFEYGTSPTYGSSVPCSALPEAGYTLASLSASIGSLSEHTTYHFRIVASNENGTSYGSDESFTTSPSAPIVVTGVASSIAATTATLNATVNPNGETVSSCEFEYGTSSIYGFTAPCSTLPGSGESPVAVSASVADLGENTFYHFRIVATNPSGTSDGADQRLRTLPGAPEYGRCVKVLAGTGSYAIPACTTPGGKGDYEWYPGLVKAGFSTSAGGATFETVKGSRVTCAGESGTGEHTGHKTVAGVRLAFTGCEQSGESCSSGVVAGEVVSSPLEGTLGVDKLGASSIKDKIGLDLYPVGKTGPIAEFSCGLSTVSIQGSVIAPVKANKMSLTQALKLRESKGKQKPEGFVGEPKDVLETSLNGAPFEQTGLTLTITEASEEAVEVNAGY